MIVWRHWRYMNECIDGRVMFLNGLSTERNTSEGVQSTWPMHGRVLTALTATPSPQSFSEGISCIRVGAVAGS
jgi:hypothetical protein